MKETSTKSHGMQQRTMHDEAGKYLISTAAGSMNVHDTHCVARQATHDKAGYVLIVLLLAACMIHTVWHARQHSKPAADKTCRNAADSTCRK